METGWPCLLVGWGDLGDQPPGSRQGPVLAPPMTRAADPWLPIMLLCSPGTMTNATAGASACACVRVRARACERARACASPFPEMHCRRPPLCCSLGRDLPIKHLDARVLLSLARVRLAAPPIHVHPVYASPPPSLQANRRPYLVHAITLSARDKQACATRRRPAGLAAPRNGVLGLAQGLAFYWGAMLPGF